MRTVSIVAVKDSNNIVGYSSDRQFVGQLHVTNGNIEQAYITSGNIIVQYIEGGKRYINTYRDDFHFVSKLPL